MTKSLVTLCVFLLTLAGAPQAHSQPITGTGPDKLMWKQIALDAWQVAADVRSGEMGPSWKEALREVAEVRPILFWAVVDYAKGEPIEDPYAEGALADLWNALKELHEMSQSAP